MDNFKDFLTFAAACIIIFATIVASWGCFHFGLAEHKTYYMVLGIINLGWCYIPGKYIAGVIKQHLKSE